MVTRPFHVFTVAFYNYQKVLHTDSDAALMISPTDDLADLPARYRAYIYEQWGADGDRAWNTLLEIVPPRLARLPDNDRLQDTAWLLGLRERGSQRVTELRAWQKTFFGKRLNW